MIELNSDLIMLKSLKITASQELASEDVSDQSSSTDSAETGAKAKILTVTGYIRFKDARHLSDLFNMAEATEAGARMIYRISNRTASTLGIKQVRFSGKIDAVEQDSTRQWRVNFTLSEYRSVPEKKEQRLPQATANQQGGEVNADSEKVGVQYASLDKHLSDNFGKLRA